MNLNHEIVVGIAGVGIILSVLLDAFETMVLPRRVTRHFRLTAWFYRRTWTPWRKIARRIETLSRQQNFLGYFGPLSLLMLLFFWAAGLILGFALVQYGVGGHEQLSGERMTFGKIIYHSGETFFTLGYGDIVPTSGAARALSVLESGMGFAFLGIVIGYLPVVYASFSRREIQISMLDARAGSPPTAVELLVRLAGRSDGPSIEQMRARRSAARLGALVGGVAGEPHFVSGAEFLSFAAQQPVLAGGADDDAGCDFADSDRRGRRASGAGEADVCHGEACGGRSGAGGECALRSVCAGALAGRGFRRVTRDVAAAGLNLRADEAARTKLAAVAVDV